MLPRHVVAPLQLAAKLCGSSVKDESAVLVIHFAERHKETVEKLFQRAGSVWIKVAPFFHSAAYLSTPGAFIRVGSRTMTAAEWLPLYEEITSLYALLVSRGWSKTKIMSFFKRAALQRGASMAEASITPPFPLPSLPPHPPLSRP
jgi:hypothetical protein